MVSKFLYFIAAVTLLLIGVGVYIFFNWQSLLTPSVAFEEKPALTQTAYAAPDMWYARSGDQKLTEWQPEGFDGEDSDALNAAVFFVHPTTYLSSDAWNGPLDDAESQANAKTYVRSMGSALVRAGNVWAPRYRQASIGAFFSNGENATKALDLAYSDVETAYEEFLAEIPADQPIILAGHSQGALHIMRLLAQKVKGSTAEKRVVAAYIVGWPIGIKSDLPALPFPACTSPKQTSCIMSWQSYAEPADYADLIEAFDATASLTGLARTGDTFVCSNPLLGGASGAAGEELNFGTLKPNKDMTSAELIAKSVPARCDKQGMLLIGNPPDLGPFVLPGNNYHVYDYALFWRNIRADVEQRVRAFQ